MIKKTIKKIFATATPRRHQKNSCSFEELQDMVEKFAAWLERAGYSSYDPYDIWGTGYGRWARRLYYEGNPVGKVLTAPVILMEMICPWLRKLFVKKDRFATADAQLVMAFLNLYEVSQRAGGQRAVDREFTKERINDCQGEMANDKRAEDNEEAPSIINHQPSSFWLDKAKELAEQLLVYSIPGYSGYCWGYPFDWQNVNGLMRKYTPHITATPYCFEAFLNLFDATGDARYLEIARSVVAFVFNDLNDTLTGENAAASSYTPFDHGKVVNASAYRAYVLFEAAQRFGLQNYADKAWKNLRFILQSQRSDGSWLYAIDQPGEAFIDHFHTCFVLKNLYKINLRLKDTAVGQAIENGYAYYRRELFDQNGLPKSFAIQPRIQISQLEMYNVAEAINLGTLLRDCLPEAFAMAQRLASVMRKRFQLQQGCFITRRYIGGINHRLPFLRWPQAQLFYAVSNLLVSMVQVKQVFWSQVHCQNIFR
jgi:hypothetical protein